MKRPKEYKQGDCETCGYNTKVERPVNSFHAWCCAPCLERMKAKAIRAGRESRLFG